MDQFERANLLFSVFKAAVEHGPKFGAMQAAAMDELIQINEEMKPDAEGDQRPGRMETVQEEPGEPGDESWKPAPPPEYRERPGPRPEGEPDWPQRPGDGPHASSGPPPYYPDHPPPPPADWEKQQEERARREQEWKDRQGQTPNRDVRRDSERRDREGERREQERRNQAGEGRRDPLTGERVPQSSIIEQEPRRI